MRCAAFAYVAVVFPAVFIAAPVGSAAANPRPADEVVSLRAAKSLRDDATDGREAAAASPAVTRVGGAAKEASTSAGPAL